MAEPTETGAKEISKSERIQIEQHTGAGLLWFAGWLFTLGYLQLPLARALLALVLWPYYLGESFAPVTAGVLP